MFSISLSFYHHFVTGVLHGGSSWFNSFFKSSSRFLLEELKYLLLLASRGAINSPYSFEVEFCISSFFSVIQSFPFAAGYHLIISEMLSISPQQAYSFVVDFLNNSVQPFPSKFLSFHSFNSFRRFCVMSSSSIIPSSEARILFLHVSAGVLPKSFQSYSFLISF